MVVALWIMPAHSHPLSACLVGEQLYVACEGQKAILVFNRQGQVQHRIALGYRPSFVFAETGCERVYVTSPEAQGIDVIDARQNRTVAHIGIPHALLGGVIDEGQREGYVCDAYKSILHVFRADTLEPGGMIHLSSPGFRPVLQSSHGKIYVGSSTEPGQSNRWSLTGGRVDIVDVRAKRLLKSVSVPGVTVRALAAAKDGFVYAVANVRGELVRIDVAKDEIDPHFRVPIGRANDMVVDDTRGLVYLSCEGIDEQVAVVDIAAQRQVLRFHAGEAFMAANRAQDGRIQRLYVPNYNRNFICVVDLEDMFHEP